MTGARRLSVAKKVGKRNLSDDGKAVAGAVLYLTTTAHLSLDSLVPSKGTCDHLGAINQSAADGVPGCGMENGPIPIGAPTRLPSPHARLGAEWSEEVLPLSPAARTSRPSLEVRCARYQATRLGHCRQSALSDPFSSPANPPGFGPRFQHRIAGS